MLDAARLRALLAPAAGSLHQVVLCACGSGAWQSVSSQLGSLAQVAHRAGVTSVVAFRIPVSIDGANAVTRALYDGVLRELRSLEDAHLRAQQALAGQPTLDWAALQLLARAEDGHDTRPVVFRPYRGLLPFRREHRPFFFGRERVVREVVEELAALVETPEVPDLLFLAGASGVGKSSLLAAGVLPALEARWPGLTVRTMRPGAEPLRTLEEVEAGLGAGPSLLVIDQLEELFTHGAPKDEIARFAEKLWALMQERVRCLAAIRGDFLDRLGEVPLPDGRRLDTFAYDDAHRVFIPRLLPEELRQAVAWPAAVVGLDFSPGLVERILEEVGHEPGALPLVQHCLDQLWERREGRTLTLRAYEQEVQGVHGALRRHADAVITMLQAEDRAIARRLLTELVAFQGQAALSTRRRRPLDTLRRDLGAPEGLDRVIAALVDARLLVSDDGDPSRPAFLEIAHEALIRRWPTLGAWLEEGAEARAARDWLRGLATERAREPGFVLRGAQLVAAQEVRERFSDELPADLVEFIGVSEAAAAELARQEEAARAAEQARIVRESRRARRTLIVSAIVLVGVLGLLVFAVRQKREADAKELAANIAEHKLLHSRVEAEDAVRKAAIATEAAEKAEQKRADADKATEKAQIAEAAAIRREAAATLAAQSAEAQRRRAVALARDAEEQALQARMAMEEARERARVLDLRSRDLHIVQTATTLLDQDPTAAAALLREVLTDDPMELPGWSELAAKLIRLPLSRRVIRDLPAPVVKIIPWRRPAGEGLQAFLIDAEGGVAIWRISGEHAPEPQELGEVLDLRVTDFGGDLAVLRRGARGHEICLLPIDGATGDIDTSGPCEHLEGVPDRIDAITRDDRSVVLSDEEHVWWWTPADRISATWTIPDALSGLGPVVGATWKYGPRDADQVVALTPVAPVLLELDGGELSLVRVIRRSGHRRRLVAFDEGDEWAYLSADLVRYVGHLDPNARHGTVLRLDLTETGENTLQTFDLRALPWRLKADREHVTQLDQGAEIWREGGVPTTVQYNGDAFELLIGHSTGVLEVRDLETGEQSLLREEAAPSFFARVEIEGEGSYVSGLVDGALRLGAWGAFDSSAESRWVRLAGHTGRIAGAAMDGDGGLLSSDGEGSPTLRRWEIPGRSSELLTWGAAEPTRLGWYELPLLGTSMLFAGMNDQSAYARSDYDGRMMLLELCVTANFGDYVGGCTLVPERQAILRVVQTGLTLEGPIVELRLEDMREEVLSAAELGVQLGLVGCPELRAVAATGAELLALRTCSEDWILWRYGANPVVRTLPTESPIQELQLSSDGEFAAGVAEGGRLSVWQLGDDASLVGLPEQGDVVASTLSREGGTLFTATAREIRSQELGTDAEPIAAPIPCTFGVPTTLRPVVLPDGEALAVGCSSGEIFALSGSLEELSPLQRQPGAPVTLLETDAAGSRLISQDGGGVVRLWSLTRHLHDVVIVQMDPLLSVAFSHRQDELALLDRSNRIEYFSLEKLDALLQTMWSITDDCLDVASRVRLLGVSEEEARDQIAACKERL